MTKSELKQLIKECINEVFTGPYTHSNNIIDDEIKIVSIAIGYENEIKEYIPKMVEIGKYEFDTDVIFTKNFKEPYEKENEKLPDNHIKVKTHFTITGITDEPDKVEILKSLKELQEELTMWSISKNLANIDFYFIVEQ